MESIKPGFDDLFRDDVKAFAFLATLMPDGTPQVTPLWFNTDGEHILINSAKGRVKDRNMRDRPEIAMTIMDLADPYRYLQVRGRVVEISEEGADDHINILSQKYFGRPFPFTEGEIRVIYKIRPE
jgi:PPOX class probable F420-dependent enzyme